MRSPSCLIDFDNGNGDTIRCGKPTVADCSDCGISICNDYRTECCGQSFCDQCYDYHAEYSCLRKAAHTEEQSRRSGKDAA